MSRTPVFIVCSTRPFVGKTLLSRLLAEFLLLQRHDVVGFDLNLKEPSLIDFLPRVTETADVMDTFGKIDLMERLIVNDGIGKVVDLGFHAYDEFFKMIEEVGYMKEAQRRGVDPIVMFIADSDRGSGASFAKLRRTFATFPIVPVDNEHVLQGEPRTARTRAGLARPPCRARFSTISTPITFRPAPSIPKRRAAP